MDERIDRRTVLRSGAAAGLALLAGCDEAVTSTEESPTAGPTTGMTATGLVPSDCETGAAQPDEQSGTATLWHIRTESGTALLDRTTEQFGEATDHAIDPSRVPSSIPARLAAVRVDADLEEDDAERTPHLFEWTHDRAVDFYEGGTVTDQSGAVEYPRCQLFDIAADAASYEGREFGVPFAGETVALLYNREMVDAPPETLSEMQSIMDEFHDPANGTYGLGYPVTPYHASGFAQAYGGEIYDGAADTLGVADDAVERGLAVLFEELQPYMPDNPGSEAQRSVFREGAAPFLISGPWELSGYDPATDYVDVGVATLPTLLDGGEPRPYAGVRLQFFGPGVVHDPDGAGAARDYAEWVATNEDVLLEHARDAGYVPVHRGLLDNGRLPDRIETFARQVRDGYPMPQNPKMDQVWGPFGDAVVDTFDDEGELAENLAAAEEEIRDAWAED